MRTGRIPFLSKKGRESAFSLERVFAGDRAAKDLDSRLDNDANAILDRCQAVVSLKTVRINRSICLPFPIADPIAWIRDSRANGHCFSLSRCKALVSDGRLNCLPQFKGSLSWVAMGGAISDKAGICASTSLNFGNKLNHGFTTRNEVFAAILEAGSPRC